MTRRVLILNVHVLAWITASIVVPCWVVEIEESEFISESNSSLKNEPSIVFSYDQCTNNWPGLRIIKALHKVNGPITDRVPITARNLIGTGPITNRVPITDQDLIGSGQITDRVPIIDRDLE